MQFPFDNSYARDLEGLYLKVLPTSVSAPQLIRFNHPLAAELGLESIGLEPTGFERSGATDAELAAIFSGNDVQQGAEPLAMAYAGHQFGHFSPQLGDGRAILLGEVVDRNGERRDIQLKGSGRTPFSRGGDGRSALGPVLREYIVSEAMHALGIPATRALAAVLSGDYVARDGAVPGGIFTRVAASHIRVGTFQFFASRGDLPSLKRLADYTIKRHYPQASHAECPALALLEMIAARQMSLIAKWLSVGFVHGVMNTDNCAVSGQTIDFGPCAFIDHYDPHAVFSSIDRDGRYASSNQAAMAQWNLARLAECLVPLIDDDQDKAVVLANEVLGVLQTKFENYRRLAMSAKFGFATGQAGDDQLMARLLDQMQLETVDYTNAFRSLCEQDNMQFMALFSGKEQIREWYRDWQRRLTLEGRGMEGRDGQDIRADMRRVNPAYIPRNHRIEEVIRAATDNADFVPFHRLVDVMMRPFDDQPENSQYRNPPQEGERVTKTFCGT